jgi:hypothetical protein
MRSILPLIFLGLVGCSSISPTSSESSLSITPIQSQPIEQVVREIPLQGPIANKEAEISGMGWYDDVLILLPQYPSRFGDGPVGKVFAIHKQEILGYLDGKSNQPILPLEISFYDPDISRVVKGFEGYEGIAFNGERVFLTIEAKPNTMMGYIVSGTISSDLAEIRLDTSKLTAIPPQAGLSNMSDESIMVIDDSIITIYEANGINVNPSPVVHQYFTDLTNSQTINFPNIEYRITDATTINGNGKFWVINYFYTGDSKLKPGDDTITMIHGKGETHLMYDTVERLVELQFRETGITFTETPPIQMQLLDDDNARNWEALAKLDDRGFLIATDKYPETIFGFVAKP